MLPLSAIRPGELREGQALRREPGFVGVVDQLIAVQPQYRNVFSNLLGRVAVMEDLDHAIAAARKYGYKFRIVTLDGQVLNPGGSMTGGSASRSAGILSRANELERLNEQGRGLREQLAQARINGFAIDDGEIEPGLICVGAPIFGLDQTVVAAVSIAGPTFRMKEELDVMTRAVKATAANISRLMGGRP